MKFDKTVSPVSESITASGPKKQIVMIKKSVINRL